MVTAAVLLQGCASVPRGSIPVVDQGSAVSNSERVSAKRNGTYRAPAAPAPVQAMPEDSGVTVMVPTSSAPIQASAAPISTSPITPGPVTSGPAYSAPTPAPGVPSGSLYNSASVAPSGIPSASQASGGLAADEQLDGPVLALLTTAQQQQGGGDLNGASSSLERAQRIAPREPQVLFRLAQVRLAQGDAAQAEQFARRALSYANGRPDLQTRLWETIAQAREKQGDAAGAALARQNARG
nr:tetratricopeptide repeat protein [Pseudomonas sp. RIT-PI-S]